MRCSRCGHENKEGAKFCNERYAEKLRIEKGINLQMRVGSNTGEVVVRSIRKDDLHTDYVPVGHSTNLASRMESLASGGAVVANEHTHKLTEGYFEFKSLGVIGKGFFLGLLKQVVDQSEETLQQLLSHLQAAEFI